MFELFNVGKTEAADFKFTPPNKSQMGPGNRNCKVREKVMNL